MQQPEVLSGDAPGNGPRLPSWLRRTVPAVGVVAATVVLGSPLLYDGDTAGTGGTEVTPTASPSPIGRPAPLLASAPLAAVPAGAPELSFVGRVAASAASSEPRYVVVSGGSVRPLPVPERSLVVPTADGANLLISDARQRLYSRPVDPDAAPDRIGDAASVLGSREERVFVTFDNDDEAGQTVRIVNRENGVILNRRYLSLAVGETAVGIVDAGNTVVAIVRTRGSPSTGTLVLRWPDREQLQLTRHGQFLGASAGVAAVRPGPDECGPPVRLCVLAVRPGPVKDLRGGAFVAPEGWTPEFTGPAPVAFVRGTVVFPVRSTAGVRALAATAPNGFRARLVPGSRDVVPAYGLASNGGLLVWGVGLPGRRVTPVYWDAARPTAPARKLVATLPAGFQFTCACS